MARTRGATSCILIKLSDLNQKLGPDATIPVARRFVEQLGLLGKAEYLTKQTLEASGNPPEVIEHTVSVNEIE